MFFRISAIVFFVCCAWSCKKDPSIWQIRNLNGNKITVVGHGGMGIHYRYPMNSLESLQACLAEGTGGTEMDVCVTKDSVLVLCHSQKLSDNTQCEGFIRNKTWSEIKDCKFNTPLLEKASIIDAATFFNSLKTNKGLIFTFDCKVETTDDLDYLNLFATALVKHINAYQLVSCSFIESFNTSFLEILQAKNKDLRLFIYTQKYQTGLDISKTINLYGLTISNENISAAEIAEAHKNKLRVSLFNTRTEQQNLDAVAKSPDYIQTDKVVYLINALKE